jgi:cell division septum initiation protein DivIVA
LPRSQSDTSMPDYTGYSKEELLAYIALLETRNTQLKELNIALQAELNEAEQYLDDLDDNED